MVKRFSLRRLIIISGVFALLFSIFLALHETPTARSDDPSGTLIESDDSHVTQQGTWTTQAANSASDGSYLYSSGDESDALLLAFEGTRIEIIYVKNPTLGDFAIEIDNTIHRTVVTTSNETSFGNSAVVDYLEAGPHVVKIFAVEGVIAIDAFIGTPYMVAGRTEASTPDYSNLGPERVGEIEPSTQEFNYRAESGSLTQTIHEPGATYIKVHFAEMNLADGETVTVSNPDGSEVYTYPGSGFTTDADPGFWAFSIIGDTAIVEIQGRSPNPDVASGNVTIDKYARGYSEGEMMALAGPQTESTCGTEQRTDVACYSGSHPTEFNNSNAVARILISGVGSCTAWRISPGNYLLTNEHCITNQTNVDATEVRFNYQRDTCGGSLNLGTVVSGSTFLTDNYNLDFALFTVDDFASISSFGYLDPDVRASVLSEEIYIPQHGGGLPKQFGIASDFNTGNVCRIDDVVLNGRGTNTDTGYYCDTIGGSSGSPVLARSSHRVLAIHHYGIDPNVSSTCQSNNMNSGTRMDLIYPFITSYFNAYKTTTPTIITPSGTVEDTTPTYSWNAQANASWYQLYVNGPSGNVVNIWYTASAVGCGAGTGTCSITPTNTLAIGAHQWWIHAWSAYGSAWSAQGNFTISIGVADVINRISPTGSVSTNPPTFSWTADEDATWYRLYVNDPTGTKFIDQWFSDTNAGCPGGTGTCSVTPATVQQGGTHQWWMQAWGPGGYGPWNSTPLNFTQTNGTTLPGLIVGTLPSGDTADNTPTYTWNADPWAEWYYLVVRKGSTDVITQWYSRADAGCPSGTGPCSVTPSTVLARGNHTWWMQGWDSLGFGPWNAGVNFNVTVGAPTTAVTTISPTGDTANRTPTFTWNASNEATQYRLYVNNPSSVALIDQTFTAASVGCGAGTGTCSHTPAGPILSVEGTHSWWVQVLNPYGDGPWSTTKTFNFKLPVPGVATLVSPNGAITGNKPTYAWNANPNATWYYLYVRNNVGATVLSQWYSAISAGCTYGTGTCSVTPTTALTLTQPDSYNWWLQTYSSSGYGPWSSALPFSINGFNSQFNGSATGWVSHTGIWSFADGQNLYTAPSATDLSTASNSTSYNNFDYQARLWRSGCDSCSNMIIVRGDPANASTNPGNNWTSGYRFQITRSGYYSVFRIDSGVTVQLQAWTPTSAIVQGNAWNTLRVTADGSNLSFRINGTLVWTGTDATYTSGREGIGMYRDSVAPDNIGELWVDWATLITLNNTPAPFGEVSPQQRALNEAANRNESTSNPDTAASTGTGTRTESNSGPVVPPSSNGDKVLPRED